MRSTKRLPSLLDSGIRLAVVLALFCVIASPAVAAEDGTVDLPRYPSISPDGGTIAFSWRGDVWTVSSEGGRAMRLTNHPADDLLTAFSPDGSLIAFNSDRNGYMNIYLMDADGTNVRQLTDIDRPCRLIGFGTDGQGEPVVLFDSVMEGDVYRERRPYMVGLQGGDMMRVHDAFGAEPRTSPDGEKVVFSRGGYYDGWARRHYRGPEASNVWLYDRGDESFRQLTDWEGNDGKSRWGGDRTLLFMSDREDRTVNLYRMSAADGEGTIARVTNFTDRDLADFDVSGDGSMAVLHVWDALYTLDLDDPAASPQRLTITAAQDDRDNFMLKSIGREVSEAALSPDGKVMAVAAYGEIFVRNMEDDSPTRRVTRNSAREQDLAWSPDGLKLYFVSDEDGTTSIYSARVDTTRSDLEEQFEKATGEESETEVEAIAEKAEEPAAEGGGEAAIDPNDPVSGVWTGTAEVQDVGPVPYSITMRLMDDGSVEGTVEAGMFSGSLAGQYDAGSRTLSLSFTAEDGTPIDMTLVVGDGELTGTAIGGDQVVNISATRTGGLPAEDAEPADGGESDGKGKKKEKKEEELPKELQPDRWHDAMTFIIEPVLQRENNDSSPTPSPDGKKLAFKGTRGDVHILDLETGEITNLLQSWDAWSSFRWSPDSRHIAYAQQDLNFNSDIFIIPADGSAEPVNITRHPDNDEDPSWSADGKILSFVSERIEEQYDVWSVYLDEDLEALTPKQLEEYYEEQSKAAKKRKPLKVEPPKKDDEEEDAEAEPEHGGDADEDGNAENDGENEDENADDAEEEEEEKIEDPGWELDTAYLRVRRITSLNGNESSVAMTPAGDRLIFNSRGDISGLFSVKYDGSDRQRLAGFASVQQVSLTGDKVVVVAGGRVGTVGPAGGSLDFVDFDDRIRVDLAKLSEQKFSEAARVLGEQYYHPTMNGVDWDALTRDYLELAKKARTTDEFNWIANRFVGELNGSHMGVYASDPTNTDTSPNQHNYGRLGVRTERVDNGLEVVDIIEQSPAAKGPMALQAGDVITAVEFDPIDSDETLEEALRDRIGDETVITIERTMENGDGDEEADGDPDVKSFSVFLTPISFGAERQLAYEQWRRENARLVNEWSDGRLGYIHIQGMNQPSLDVFERDLFAAAEGKDGLILDVRNNGGGWTTDRVLSSIMVQSHAYTVPRGASWDEHGHYPQDRLFIQRYMMPMNLLCNEKSYSNAEIMSHAFKTLDRGTLVGQQTHGSVISTGGFGLLDGTFVRLPFRGWFVDDGTGRDMELNGAMPDIVVPQRPEAEVAGEDEQLRTAVEDLMKRLD